MTILDEIIQYKRKEELPRQMKARKPALVQAEAALAPAPIDFVAALQASTGVALIAEVKKASPSKGLLRHDFDPLKLATVTMRDLVFSTWSYGPHRRGAV